MIRIIILFANYNCTRVVFAIIYCSTFFTYAGIDTNIQMNVTANVIHNIYMYMCVYVTYIYTYDIHMYKLLLMRSLWLIWVAWIRRWMLRLRFRLNFEGPCTKSIVIVYFGLNSCSPYVGTLGPKYLLYGHLETLETLNPQG